VGTSGAVIRTTNGGANWTSHSSGTSVYLYGVSFSDANNGTAVGVGGTIIRTTNSGISWIRQTSPTIGDLWGVTFTDSCTGTAVGSSGRIFRTTTGGVTWVDDRNDILPKQFSLFHNYPNPFNPSTTISYQLTSSSFVTLKVFDLLGREVATLVNEEMKPGRYEKNFDASGLASGVYLYRLQADGFVEVRRLVLVK
jgi:hypothetical protein